MMLSPAEYVIHVFGSGQAVANVVGKTRQAVYLWKRPRKLGGCDGKVPTRSIEKILKAAKLRGLDLTAEDLIRGRNVRKVDLK